jgi:hypothetical protein
MARTSLSLASREMRSGSPRRGPGVRLLLVATAALPLPGMASGPEGSLAHRARLNDTGVTQCVVYHHDAGYRFTPKCEGTGHDGEFGRDAWDGGNARGHAGFNFAKIGSGGQILPRDAKRWHCVRDKITGLTWEVKTHDGGPRDAGQKFTNRGDGRDGDASAYLADVNAAGLCGASDWRMPTRREMESLVDFSVPEGGPMIDAAWFPDSAATLHWTSTSAEVNGGAATYRWAVNYFAGGSSWHSGRYNRFSVRLVRRGHDMPTKRWNPQGAEVLDRSTLLVWRRCAEGQAWTGSTCSGTAATFFTITDAIDHAKEQARSAGLPWRAPNVKELSSLVDTELRFPSIDSRAFPGLYTDSYHTATHWTENPVYSWRVNFGEGLVALDFWGGKMLLVRDAE